MGKKALNKFTWRKDGTLNCLSGSGSNYIITPDSCECAGFKFRRSCSHYKQADEKGLIAEMRERWEKKPPSNPLTKGRSPHITEHRKKAIAAYLEQAGIVPNKSLVDKLEKKVTSKMTSAQFLTLARKLR